LSTISENLYVIVIKIRLLTFVFPEKVATLVHRFNKKMNRFLLLSLSFFATLCIGMSVSAQTGGNRGDAINDEASLQAAQKSLELQLIVEEIEDAGFELDVVEGFDEEWEEEIWVGSAADDVDVNHTDPSESNRYDLDAVPQADDLEEENWENPETVLDQAEAVADNQVDANEVESGAMRGEDDAEMPGSNFAEESDLDFALLDEEMEFAEANWWEDEGELINEIEDMEMDGYDNDYEEEDLDLLEELYNE
jgi:hypothetical protein